MLLRHVTNVTLQAGGITMKRVKKAQYRMPHHLHENYEIFYLLDGERHMFIKNTGYLMRKGDLALIPSYEIHRTADASLARYEGHYPECNLREHSPACSVLTLKVKSSAGGADSRDARGT